MYIVMECCDYDLTYAVDKGLIPDCKEACRQLLQAIAHLHSCNIAHRDLKPSNVLVHDSQIKLCDFGLAKLVEYSMKTNTVVGTLGWQAPEVVRKLKQTNSKHSDVFVAGCVIYYILTRGQHPYDGDFYRMANEDAQLEALETQHTAQALVSSMLQQNSSDRPTASTCLLRPFFWSGSKCIQLCALLREALE